LGIDNRIDAEVDGYNVERSKPAPNLFLHAAAMLEVRLATCAVIEDSEAGIQAALCAGMWAVGVGLVPRVGKAHIRYGSLEGVHLPRIIQDLEVTA
jgi:kojibiose phosphorylase